MTNPAVRRTKLVCTLGPATVGRVGELREAGMDIARINFSHGTPQEHADAVAAVRQAGDGIAILVDLPGPKIRLGQLEGGELELVAGARFTLTPAERAGDVTGAHVSYERLPVDAQDGDRILLADGAVELRVTGTDEREVGTEVVRGGLVRSGAGVNLPSERLSAPALTERDRRELPHVRELAADFVAQSFVRRAEDVAELRAALGAGTPIVVKLETRAAVDDLDRILEAADAVMVARGDLGVEIPFEEVPIVQKRILSRALEAGVPTIVATQMLESMVHAPRPTRAEASDVANAVLDGADAVMLSAETAIGEFPVLAAEAAVRICRHVEEAGVSGAMPSPQHAGVARLAVAHAATALAHEERELAAIACRTRTGRTAEILSAHRPAVPIIAVSPDPAVVRRLALRHGVLPLLADPVVDDAPLPPLAARLEREHVLPPRALVALVASSGPPGAEPNLLELVRLAAD